MKLYYYIWVLETDRNIEKYYRLLSNDGLSVVSFVVATKS